MYNKLLTLACRTPKNRAYAFQHTSAQADFYPNITTLLSLLVALIEI